MTCRHGPYDPNCGSYEANIKQLKADHAKHILSENTPDAERFSIEEIEEVGDYLIVKVTYPNCVRCAYEGTKIMVFANVTLKDAIKWKRIDPHFHIAPASNKNKTQAPSPIARFPASNEGWQDAIAYATRRHG